MTSSAISSETEPQRAATCYEQDAQHHRAVLNELIDLGTDMARLVHGQTKAEAATLKTGETGPVMVALATTFDRVVRGVRRSALLVRKLAEPVTGADPTRTRIATRERIIRGVEDAIQREMEGDEAPALHAELLDRLDSPDWHVGIGDRPVGEIITEICRDLGLGRMPGAQPWARRTPADLAVLRGRAAMAPRPGRADACAGAPVAGGAPVPVAGGAPLMGSATQQPVTRCRDP